VEDLRQHGPLRAPDSRTVEDGEHAAKHRDQRHAFRAPPGHGPARDARVGPLTSAGTSRGREEPLALVGTYRIPWSNYSTLPGPRGVFKTLVVEVAGG
jgi:hypothetical protein